MDNSVPPSPSPAAKRCSTYFVMCNGRCYNRSVLPSGGPPTLNSDHRFCANLNLNWESLFCRLRG